MADVKALIKKWGFILKFIVWILVIVCVAVYFSSNEWLNAITIKTSRINLDDLGLKKMEPYYSYSGPASSRTDYDFILSGSLVSTAYLIIMTVMLLVYMIDSTHHYFELLFLAIGMLLFLIIGLGTIIIAISDKLKFIAFILGGCELAAGIIMVIDFIRELKNKGE